MKAPQLKSKENMLSEKIQDRALPANETLSPSLASLREKTNHISGSNVYTARKYVEKDTG